jgi:hypothetical protein
MQLEVPPGIDTSMTADQMNEALQVHGFQLPANPTPAQMQLARAIIAYHADRAAEGSARRSESQRLATLAEDPDRNAAYDAARAACYFDTAALFPGWVPQPLTPGQQADADLVASLVQANGPSWSHTDSARAALYDEANRLIPLSHGRSPEAHAIRSEITRLMTLASRMGRQDSRRRRREAPGNWPRLDPWPSACQACGLPIDRARTWPDPLSESLGHEPPIVWTVRHPDYEGRRVLRPEHLVCNLAKHDRPDWEILTNPPE